MANMMKPGRRVYVDRTQTRVVPEDSPEAAILLCSASGEISEDRARELGLIDAHGKLIEPVVVAEMKALEEDEPPAAEAKVEPEPPERKDIPAPESRRPIPPIPPRGDPPSK